MTTVRQFLLPDLGEGLTEADIVRWHVAVGDQVVLNQVIAEVETAKAVVELPSPFAGTVTELKAEAGATVDVGSPIIAIDTGDEVATAPSEKIPVLVGYGVAEAPASRRRRHRANGHGTSTVPPVAAPAPATEPEPTAGRPMAKPPVRYLARQRGIDLSDVTGTGPDGVITREDVLGHDGGTPAVAPDGARETRTPIKGVRKLTAESMVRSAFAAPHVTEFITVDVTPMMELVDTLRGHSVFEGVRVTPLTLVSKALLLALRDNPSLNSYWDEATKEIVTKHYVNLGIAAATPRGLMVPNIKDAQALSLRDLAIALNALTLTARDGHTTPADMAGGTITITNIGVFGIDAGTPIINPGEAAILCFGSVRRQPWEYQGDIALRSVTTLSLSFDHRLVDGKEGSQFLSDVAKMLSDPTYLIALS
jgi:pyruvate dehydrogenase E2 component (dihydrolipoamide acetyltransferase)